MKLIGKHPSGRAIIIRLNNQEYHYETANSFGSATSFTRAKTEARAVSFTSSEMNQGLHIGNWHWKELG